MQRYKALLEKTKTLFWNRWFTTNRRVVLMRRVVMAMETSFYVYASQRTWAGALRTPDNPSDTRAIYGYGRASWQGASIIEWL